MLQALGNLGSLPFSQMGQQTQNQGITGLLTSGLKSTQNEQRLMAEKQQRNLLKKYLTQQTGDPIKSALISNIIPGRGAGDTFDVGLGTKSSIMQSLGLINQQTPNTNLIGGLTCLGNSANQSMGLMNSLGGLGGNNSTLSNLSTLGNLANLGKSSSANTGFLSSLVNMASTPNNNSSILSNLGGLGTGILGGNSGSNTGGLLGNIQSGINTLNTLNKVNNAVSGVKGLFA